MSKLYFVDNTSYDIIQVRTDGIKEEKLCIDLMNCNVTDVYNTINKDGNTDNITIKDNDTVVKSYGGYTKLVSIFMDTFKNMFDEEIPSVHLVFEFAGCDKKIDALNDVVESQKQELNEYKNDLNDIKSVINNDTDTSGMNVDQFRKYKKESIGAECRTSIYSGTTVVLNNEKKYFTYNAEDQSNLTDLMIQVNEGFQTLPYHVNTDSDTTEECEFFSATDIKTIYRELSLHKLKCTTKCNTIFVWLDSLKTIEDMKNVTFNSTLPVEYQKKYDGIINPTIEMINK